MNCHELSRLFFRFAICEKLCGLRPLRDPDAGRQSKIVSTGSASRSTKLIPLYAKTENRLLNGRKSGGVSVPWAMAAHGFWAVSRARGATSLGHSDGVRLYSAFGSCPVLFCHWAQSSRCGQSGRRVFRVAPVLARNSGYRRSKAPVNALDAHPTGAFCSAIRPPRCAKA